MDYIRQNSVIWDERAARNDCWTVPVSSDVTQAARQGTWHIVLTPVKHVPRSWFPSDLSGLRVLCLAGGGGQQAPVLAAAGAKVTVLDNSRNQLAQDEMVAQRDGLEIRTVQGNMQDLSAFEDCSFDMIVHPWSNGYVNDVRVVWRECARVLRQGGTLLAGFANPVEYLFDQKEMENGRLLVANRLPYADVDHLDDPALQNICDREGYLWSHTLEDQLGGQTEAGLAIIGMYEDCGGTVLDQYMSGSIATRAIKW